MFQLKAFPHYHQLDQTDCGPTCLKIIAAYYGKYLDIDYLRKISNKSYDGSTFANLADAGKQFGIDLNGFRITVNQLNEELPLPTILHWKQNHFVVIYQISKKYIKISDPEILFLHLRPYKKFGIHLGAALIILHTIERTNYRKNNSEYVVLHY